MFNIFGTRIDVCIEDPLKVEADGLVIPANDHLWMGAGLAGTVKKEGGEEIEVEAVRQGPAHLGQAVATAGGSLPYRRIYHAVLAEQDLRIHHEQIGPVLAAVFATASKDGIERLAVAPLESEELIGAFHDAARALVTALLEQLDGEGAPQELVLLVSTDEAKDAYRQAFLAGLGAGN